jgi:hypothetical protein
MEKANKLFAPKHPKRNSSLLAAVFIDILERAMGIEPTAQAWEAWVLPLYDARSGLEAAFYALWRSSSILS